MREDEIDGHKYVASREFVDDIVVDCKNSMKYYFTNRTDDGKSFHEKWIHKEVGESSTEGLKYDREKCDDEDVLEIKSLDFVGEWSEHKGSECYFTNHVIVTHFSMLNRGSYVCLELGIDGSIFPRNKT